MPYIKENDRIKIKTTGEGLEHYDYGTEILLFDQIMNAGELQYAMAVMFKSYIERKGLTYQHCNDIMGALAGAQMEFYRRHVARYEDDAITRNGDIE